MNIKQALFGKTFLGNGLNRAFSVPENYFWETFLGKIWENLFLGIRKSVFRKFLGKTERILKNDKKEFQGSMSEMEIRKM